MYYWPLIGALMLGTFADAQRSESVRPICWRDDTIEFDTDKTGASGGGQSPETSSTPVASSHTTANPWTLSLTTSGYVVRRKRNVIDDDDPFVTTETEAKEIVTKTKKFVEV